MKPFVEVDNLEQQKILIEHKYNTALSHMYNVELHKIMKWFTKKYPNRKLRWISAMGSSFWSMDVGTEAGGYDISDWNITDLKYSEGCWEVYHVDAKPDRIAMVLKPLWDIYQSINDVTNCVGNFWIQTDEFNSDDYHNNTNKLYV